MKMIRKMIMICLSVCVMLPMMQASVFAEEADVTYPDSYTIYPTPQNIEYGTDGVSLHDVNLVVTDSIDTPAKTSIEEVLNSNHIMYTYSDTLSDAKTNIVLGIVDDNLTIQGYFEDLHVTDSSALHELEGYVLSVRDGDIYIMGSESVALYYGVLTLKQIINTSKHIKDMLINDYSDNVNRGTVEGFYGIPWSQEARKDILTMMGEYKMNQYVYAPKDDPYHFGEAWYEPYPAKELAEMKELVETANAGNVEFVYTLHVSNYMDLTDDDDAANALLPERVSTQWDISGTDSDRGVYVPEGQHAIDAYSADETWDYFIAKFEQMYDIGVRRFGILADDISFPVARYSIPYLVNFMNDIQEYLMTTYDDVEALLFCPSYYYQQDTRYNGQTYMKYIKNGYNQAITTGLDENVEVMWTGLHVMSNINYANSEYLHTWIGRDPLIWWNYPVTDYVPRYILLGPNPGLKDNATNMTGVLSNPMQQGFASEISLFGVADYSWNISGYDTNKAWKDSFNHLFPEVADSLYLIAQNATTGYDSQALEANKESVYLQPYLTAFKTAVTSGDTEAIADAGADLTLHFDDLLYAINDVRTNCATVGLVEDLKPWLDKLESLCTIGNAIITAYTSDDTTAIWNAYSIVNAEINSWPSITVAQLESATVAAEIGIAHLTPFIETMATTLEEGLNERMLNGDILTTTNRFITNVPSLEAVDIIKEGKTYRISDITELTLQPHHYVGMKLECPYLTDSITYVINEEAEDAITVEYSINGIEWTKLEGHDLDGAVVRYVRILNTTNEDINLDIESLAVTITGPQPTKVNTITANTSIYSNNRVNNLIDGNYRTPYWTNAPQAARQEVIITYDEVFELYDFALYEATGDYIRNGSIYSSVDGVTWDNIGSIGTNFVTEKTDGESYNVIRGYVNGKATKYIKIATEGPANNWTKLHEWEVNQIVEKDTGIMYPFNAIAEGRAYNVIDNHVKTMFTTTSDEGYLQYILTENNNASQIVILQNSQSISDAIVSIRTSDGWHEIGTLSQAANTFDITDYRDVLELKLEWADNGVVPQINEIYTVTSDVDKTTLLAAMYKSNIILNKLATNSEQYVRLQNALLYALAVVHDEASSRGHVADAIAMLNVAMFVDKAALQALVDDCLALNEGDYTSETWVPFVVGLLQAQEVLEDDNAIQGEVDASYHELSTVYAALEKVTVPDEEEEDNENNQGPDEEEEDNENNQGPNEEEKDNENNQGADDKNQNNGVIITGNNKNNNPASANTGDSNSLYWVIGYLLMMCFSVGGYIVIKYKDTFND